jgi:aminopeptidase YwaD
MELLTKLGWQAIEEPFSDHSADGKQIDFCNISARYSIFPASQKRFVIGAHFDTLPTQLFRAVGGTDGTANTAVLIELSRVLALDPQLAGQVELLFLDGNAPFHQLNSNDGLFGSRFHIQMARISQHASDVQRVIILGNVGSQDFSLPLNSDRTLVEELKIAAHALGFNLQPANRSFLTDHVPFEQAGIPATTLLEADALQMNSADDTVEHLKSDSLSKVGQLVLYYLANQGANISTAQ